MQVTSVVWKSVGHKGQVLAVDSVMTNVISCAIVIIIVMLSIDVI